MEVAGPLGTPLGLAQLERCCKLGLLHYYRKGFPGGSLVKNRLQCRRPWLGSWIGKIRWRRHQALPSLGFSRQEHWSVQVPFRSSNLNVVLLLGCSSGQGPHLGMTGEPLGFSLGVWTSVVVAHRLHTRALLQSEDHSVGSKRYLSRLEKRVESFASPRDEA